MAKYLGETPVLQEESPYAGFGPKEWALAYITAYGGIDGDHHKAWVLDQVAHILHGTPIHIKLAKWDNGTEEYRFNTGKPSEEYHQWVKDICEVDEVTGEAEYDYNEGIAP